MKDKISNQQTIRIYDDDLLQKLNEKYILSDSKTANEFINHCLKIAIKSEEKIVLEINNIKEILEDKNLSSGDFESANIILLRDIIKSLKLHEKLLCNIYNLNLNQTNDDTVLTSLDFGFYDSLPARFKNE